MLRSVYGEARCQRDRAGGPFSELRNLFPSFWARWMRMDAVLSLAEGFAMLGGGFLVYARRVFRGK